MKRRFRIGEYESDPGRDVREEMDAHLELEVERLQALGMGEAEARRAAELRFGDRKLFAVEAEREASAWQRRARWRSRLESLGQDVRYGFRRLVKSPGFTAVTFLILALGISAVSALFTVVHSVLLSPLPFDAPERLVFAWETRQDGSLQSPVSPLNFREWRESMAGSLELAAVRPWPYNVTGGEAPERLTGYQVSSGLLSLLRVAPAAGREFTRDEERGGSGRVCVVSHGFWLSRLGGDPDLASVRLTLNGESYAVVGVLPEGFAIPGFAPGPILTPLPLDPANAGFRDNHNAAVLGRLQEGVSPDRAGRELGALATRLQTTFADWNDGIGAQLVPALNQIVQGSRLNLWVLFGSVVFVLLIACANIGSLFLARAMAAEHEFAIRYALGARRSRVVRLVLSEAVILGAAGGFLGFWGCGVGIGAIRRWAPGNIPRMAEVSVSLPVVGFVVAVSLGTALLFGLLPAILASRVNTGSMLKEGGRGVDAGGRQKVQRILVTSQIAVTVVLLVGSGLLVRTFTNLLNVDPGFEIEGRAAMHVSLPQSSYPDRESVTAFLERVHERLDAAPGVQASASSVGLPFQPLAWRKLMTLEDQPAASLPDVPVVDLSIVTPGWLETLGIPLLRGRDLRESDDSGRPFVALVNEAFVRVHLADREPLGQRLRLAAPAHLLPADQESEFPWYTIVGVVGDVRRWNVATQAVPEVYIHQRQDMDVAREFFVVGQTNLPATTLTDVMRQAVLDVDPDQPVAWVRTMDSMYSASVARQRFNAFLVAAFGLTALVLSVIGVYGFMANAVSTRRREIGLRVALGANHGLVVRNVVRDGLLASAAGVTLGLVGSAFLAQLMRSLLFGVQPLDAVTFLIVVIVVLTAAAAAATVPSWRAARLDPTLALRGERFTTWR